MSVIQRLKCDCCNAEKAWNLDADRNPAMIPNGWWSICESDCDPQHFCSRDCLTTFVNRWAPPRPDLLPAVAAR
jgi:hypothetical protein